jgi:hypothetical protein
MLVCHFIGCLTLSAFFARSTTYAGAMPHIDERQMNSKVQFAQPDFSQCHHAAKDAATGDQIGSRNYGCWPSFNYYAGIGGEYGMAHLPPQLATSRLRLWTHHALTAETVRLPAESDPTLSKIKRHAPRSARPLMKPRFLP